MKLSIKAGKTSQTINVFVADSSSTTGAGLTGLAYNSAGLTAYYCRPQAAAASITLATLAAVTSSWSSGGFKEIDSTNMPGWYRFDIPNAVIAAGVDSVAIHLKGATNMAPLPIEIELVAYDPQDTVRLGLTALPNAAAEAAGGLYTRGSGAGQIAQDANGRISTNVVALLGTNWLTPSVAGTPDVNAKQIGGTAQTGLDLGGNWTAARAAKVDNLDATISSRSTLTQTQVTGGAYALNSASFAFNAALDFTTTQKAATVARVTLVDNLTTYTGNTPQTGDSYARIGATGSGLTSLAPASTALSTATWTNTLATNLAATNTTVATNLDAAISSRMATYTQPTGFLAATFPATVASTTNITAGTITNVTNLTNLPSIPANWITAAGITAGALNGKGDWLLSSSYTAPLDAAGIRTAVGLGAANLDLQLNSIYTVAGLVQSKTDNLPLTPASSSDCITAAGVRAAIGMSSANLDTQLATLASYIDTEVGAIYTRIGAPTGVSVSADIAAVQANVGNIQTRIPASLGANGNIKADIQDVLGAASAGAAGYMGVDWSKIINQSSVVNLLQTTFLTTQATLQVNVTQWAGEPVLSQTDGVPVVSVIRYYDVGTDGYRYYPAGFANTPAAPAAAGDCITAAGVRAAVGMAEADLDSQLDAIYTTQQTSLANQIVMDTKLNNIKVDTAAILDDTGTTGVIIAGGSGAALVAATAAQITVDHGSGSYIRNTEPPTAAQIWGYDSRTLTSGGGGGGATAAEVWEYAERTLTSGGGLTAAEVWEYADRTLTPAALDSIMAATGLESGRYLDTNGNPVTQINLRQAIALLLAYSLGDRSGIGTRSIISKLAGETVQIEAERISQSVIEASGTVPV